MKIVIKIKYINNQFGTHNRKSLASSPKHGQTQKVLDNAITLHEIVILITDVEVIQQTRTLHLIQNSNLRFVRFQFVYFLF